MKITFICVGSVKKAYIKEGVSEYVKRIRNYFPVDIIEVKEESASIKMPKDDILKKEGERVLKNLKSGDFAVVLADNGRQFSSTEFSRFIEGFMAGGKKNLCFIVGGPFGLHKSVYDASDMVMSFSAMTLPHDLARLVLAEQVYRAFTIIRGEPYSH